MKVHFVPRVGFTSLMASLCMAALGILLASPRSAPAQPAGIGVPTFKDPNGLWTIQVTRIARVRTFGGAPGGARPAANIELQVALECHKPVAFYMVLPLDEARDNAGQDLLDTQPARIPLYSQPFPGGVVSPLPQRGFGLCYLQLPHPDAKSISFLKGKVLLTECSEWAELVFENPLQAAGAVRETRHGRVTLKAMKESPGQLSCQLGVTVPSLPPLP
ncbi:MAG: hypothetical protein FJ279_36340, partial [Planctomycetes bacterium]|nr:hypothetical protein [Planctomycetota bacterium]